MFTIFKITITGLFLLITIAVALVIYQIANDLISRNEVLDLIEEVRNRSETSEATEKALMEIYLKVYVMDELKERNK